MLERLYEDATSFGFPEERFERVYGEVELTLYRDAVRARVIAPLHGAWMHARACRAGRRPLARARRRARRARHDARARVLCVLERDVPADDPIPADEAAERFASVVTAMRLWAPGGISLGAPGWRQADEARWQPVPIGSSARARGGRLDAAGRRRAGVPRVLHGDLRGRAPAARGVGARPLRDGLRRSATDAEALTDYLLGLRALLDATSDAGQASFGAAAGGAVRRGGRPRRAAGADGDGHALERYVMGHASGAEHRHGVAARAGGRGGGPPARAAARRALRLPGRRPEVAWPTTSCSRPTASRSARSRRATCARSRSRSPSAGAVPRRSVETPPRFHRERQSSPMTWSEPEPELRGHEPDDAADADRARAGRGRPAARAARARRSHRVGRLGLGRPRGLLGARLARGQPNRYSSIRREAGQVVHVVVEVGHLDHRLAAEALLQVGEVAPVAGGQAARPPRRCAAPCAPGSDRRAARPARPTGCPAARGGCTRFTTTPRERQARVLQAVVEADRLVDRVARAAR